jgi:hypothetical protein
MTDATAIRTTLMFVAHQRVERDSMSDTQMEPPLDSLARVCEIAKDREAETIWYGPHDCPKGCGRLVVIAAREQGGKMLDAPVGPVYPNTVFHPHACMMVAESPALREEA